MAQASAIEIITGPRGVDSTAKAEPRWFVEGRVRRYDPNIPINPMSADAVEKCHFRGTAHTDYAWILWVAAVSGG